jgi:hypothetical protein
MQISIIVPLAHGITLPIDGITNGLANGQSALSVSAATAASGPVAALQVSEVETTVRYRCYSASVQIANSSYYCNGNNNVRVCAARPELAETYAQTVVRPLLMGVTEASCSAAGETTCGSGASLLSYAVTRSRCCSVLGAADMSTCAKDSDCDGINTLAPQTAVAGVPVIQQQCCSNCEGMVNTSCSLTQPTPFVYSTSRCKQLSCASTAPCFGYALSRLSMMIDTAKGAEVKLASGAGFSVGPGVWPPEMAGRPASVTVNTDPLPATALPAAATVLSEVLTFEPSGIKFQPPGVRLFFTVSMARVSTDPAYEMKVHRLTDGVFVPLDGPTTFDPLTGMASAVTMGFSSYAVLQVLKPVIVVPDDKKNITSNTPAPTEELPSIEEIKGSMNVIGIAVGVAGGGLLLAVLGFFAWLRYRKSGGAHLLFERRKKPVPSKAWRDSELVVALPDKQSSGKGGGKATLLLTEGDSGSGEYARMCVLLG